MYEIFLENGGRSITLTPGKKEQILQKFTPFLNINQRNLSELERRLFVSHAKIALEFMK